MKTSFGAAVLAAVLLLGGCAVKPQAPVSLAKDSLKPANGRVGVVMSAVPAADIRYPGADCLLCLAAAAAMNSSLSTHSDTLGTEDLADLKKSVAAQIRKSGTDVVEIPAPFTLDDLPRTSATGENVARQDYSAFQQKYQIDKLVVINVNWLGIRRKYSAYVPVEDPKAVFDGVGFMVNLKTNTYEWYEPVYVAKSSDGAWDEPPKFPGLTNAYYQVLELAKDGFLKPLQPAP